MAQKLKLNSPVGADALILKWPVPTSEGKDGPEEVLDTMRLVCEDFSDLKPILDTRILKEGEDVSNYDYEQTKAMCERYNKVIESFRQPAKGHPRQKPVSKQVTMKQLKHILQQCYNHSVKDPEKLNHYEPFSPEVYGETSFELVEQMIKYVQFSESDYFIDLGSGVGQVVLQVSAATNCKFCYGVEKAEWPAEYAAGMEREFRKWMKWYGKEHGEFKIEKGDFLHDGVKEKLSKATIVFVNNFAFGPVVDHELKQRFANCLKEGARIVSSKAFCPLNFRITARNLSDIGTIMQVEELSPLCGAVSWTGKPFAYYVHTIDRTLLEKYFNRLRHPSKKDEIEPRKDRKGRPLLSIKDKINGALSGGSDSNSSGRWRRVRGVQRELETISPLSAAKVLDFDSGSNSSFTNSGCAPTVDDSSIVYGPTTRRQWNEYVKRPQSQSGTENDNDSSAADVANVEVKSKDQAEEITQKKKKMKTVKRLNNGALGKRQMQVGKKKTEPVTPVKSKAAVKLRPRQKQITRSSSATKRAIAASVSSAAASVSTTTSSVSSNVSAHTNGTILPPSLDSLNLLHAHTVMSTSGKDPDEKVNYNDRRMTETLSAYFKPTVQKQTVSMLEKEAGFLQMIETMKQRFLSFLTFMQSPEYRTMLLLQIEQEKRKNTSLKSQTESLERDISILQKDGVRLIKDRLKEMGIKADTPRELISQAKDIMLRHHELKSQTASLGAQINNLQTEHNNKVTAHRKVLDRKFAMRQSENSFCEHTYHMVNKEHLDQQRLLANINRLHAEIQHLQNVNKSHVVRPEAGSTADSSLDIAGLGVTAEGKAALKANGTQARPQVNAYTKEQMDMKENYEAFGTVLAMVKKEVTAALQNSSPAQPARLDVAAVASAGTRQETTDRAPAVSDDLKPSTQPWPSKDAVAKNAQSSINQSFKTPEASVKEIIEESINMPSMASSWTTDVRKDGAVTSTSPRILPAGMKIDIKKPSRLNGLNSTLKAKLSHPSSYTLLQNSENCANPSYKTTANGSFSKVPAFNLYTENEKSAAEDLISLKDILSTPTANAEHQGPVLNTVSVLSLSSASLPCLEYVQNHTIDSKTSIMQHSSHDNKPTILVANKPHIGSNSLSKDYSVSCAITPTSSTSHVFAQVPIATFSQTSSSNQILGTASIQVRPGQNKVKIVTSLPKNGLLKHKNMDSSFIHRPVKIRTIEAGSDAKLTGPSILSSAFYAQSQQQAQIIQAPSIGHAPSTSLAHVLKSEPGQLVSNQSFLNAHMSQTVVVSSGKSSTVGSSSLPFVTIQSPHAMPVSSGNNGVQPSLIKILQQKPIVITPKSSAVYNGTANSNGCNGSLIAVSSPALASQGALVQGESISGQAVKLLPPNGRDTKGCLPSSEPCSLVVSEFDEFVAISSPELKNRYSEDGFQADEIQASIPDSDLETMRDLETMSEVCKQLAKNTCSKDDNHCITEGQQSCRCYPLKFCKRTRELLINISKLSSESDISSPDSTNQVLSSDTGSTVLKGRSSPNTCRNSPSVILKREALLEKMAEGMSDGEPRRRRTISSTQPRSADHGHTRRHFQSPDILKSASPLNFQGNRPLNKLCRKSERSTGAGNKLQRTDKEDTFVLPQRKHYLDSKKSSEASQIVNVKKSKGKTSEPDLQSASAAESPPDQDAGSRHKLDHAVSRNYNQHCSKSCQNNLKQRNKSTPNDEAIEACSGDKVAQPVDSPESPVQKTASAQATPSHPSNTSDTDDQAITSTQQKNYTAKSELPNTRLGLTKSNESDGRSPSPALPKPEKHTFHKPGIAVTSPKPEKRNTSSPKPEKRNTSPKPEKRNTSPKLEKRNTSSPKPEKHNTSPKPEKRITSSPKPEKRITSSPKPEKRITSSPKPEKHNTSPKPEKRNASTPKPEKHNTSFPKPEKRNTPSPKPEKRNTSSPKPEKRNTSSPKPEKYKTSSPKPDKRNTSPKSEKHKTSSARPAHEKRCLTPEDIHSPALKSNTSKQHSQSKEPNISSTKTTNSSNSKHTEHLNKKPKLTDQRRHADDRTYSSRSRSPSVGEKHQSSSKRRNKQKDMSPGPPKLERAISPPSHPRKHAATSKLPSPNSESLHSFLSDSDSQSVDLWSQFCENSDKRISRDHRRRSRISLNGSRKATPVKIHQQSRGSTVSPGTTNKNSTINETISLSPKITRNSVHQRQKSSRENIVKENIASSRSKRSHRISSDAVQSQLKEQPPCKAGRLSKSSRSSESRRKTQSNEKAKVHEKSKPVKSTPRHTASISLCDTSPKEKAEPKLGLKDQSNLPGHVNQTNKVNLPNNVNLPDNSPTENMDQNETKVDSVKLQQAELDRTELTGEFALSANLDSPYGLLTPKSVSRGYQMEDDRHSDSSGGEVLHQEDNKHQFTHPYGLKLDLDAKDVQLKASFECSSQVVAGGTPPEVDSFSFPPTPGKTPRSASLPCSPSTETNMELAEEPVEKVSEAKPTDPFDVCAKKGPQTPPGSPLFNHQSRSRSRSPSVSSSSSRGSSYDSCHSTSSSSTLSDCSSDDTKRRRRRKRHYQHHKTPPPKLSTLILPVSLGIGSPPKATVLYSPMPSPSINGFNYGTQIRPGLGSTSAPGFGNYSVIASVLSPLSVSTQQSPGYQMVTSDSLRSPNGLIRSPVSGGLIRQHSVLPSPASSAVSAVTTSSSQSYAANKDTTSGQSCKSLSTKKPKGTSKKIVHGSVQYSRDKMDSIYKAGLKGKPASVSVVSAVTLDSHSTETRTNSSRIDSTAPGCPSNYKTLDCNELLIDHNANNTTMSCSHSSHSQETLASIDFNQNLCLLSTSCCSTNDTTPTVCVKQTNLALEPPPPISSMSSPASLICANQLSSQLIPGISDMKDSTETVVPHSSQEDLTNLVMDSSTYQSSLLPPSTPTLTATNNCTESTGPFPRGIDNGQSFVHNQKLGNSHQRCSLQQPQDMRYRHQPKPNHSSIADQTHHLVHAKQQPLIAQPLQQHLPSFHQTLSPPSAPQTPHHQLYMPRQSRQKCPVNSPHTQYSLHAYHAYKGQNAGNRRASYGTRFPSSHYPTHWGHLNSPVYPGPYGQNGPKHHTKPRHPPGQPRDIGDSCLKEHTGLMDYPLHGAPTHPFGPSQWDNPAASYCMGPGGIGRPVHQHYNHSSYHNKNHQ